MDSVISELLLSVRQQQNTINSIINLYERVLDIRQGRTVREVHSITLPRSNLSPFLAILQTLNTETQQIGLSEEQIENVITSIDTSSNDTCSICLSNITENHETYGFPRRINNCGHIFHRNCIHRSLQINQNCPLCRTSAISENRNDNTIPVEEVQ